MVSYKCHDTFCLFHSHTTVYNKFEHCQVQLNNNMLSAPKNILLYITNNI